MTADFPERNSQFFMSAAFDRLTRSCSSSGVRQRIIDTQPSNSISRGKKGKRYVKNRCNGDCLNRSMVYWNGIKNKSGNISVELKSRAASSIMLKCRITVISVCYSRVG